MLTKIQCIRAFNTCAAHFIILHKFNNCTISLSRLGTHPLENFFGYLRSLCRSNDMIDNMIRQICKACILKEIDSKLLIQKNINKRLNFGGVKVNSELYNSENISISQGIAESMMLMIDFDYYKSKLSTNPIHLIDFLSSLPNDDIKLSNPGLISGAHILTHIIHTTNLAKAERS